MALEAILNTDKDSSLIRNSEGHVPLHIAVESGNFAAVTSICNISPASARVQVSFSKSLLYFISLSVYDQYITNNSEIIYCCL